MIEKAEAFLEIISHLETKTGRDFSASRIDAIVQRNIYGLIDSGHVIDDFIAVIDKKHMQWRGTKYEQYVRPETLFGEKFKTYFHERVICRTTSITKLNNAVQGAKHALRHVGKKPNRTNGRTDF